MPRKSNKIKITVPATTSNLGAGFDCLGLAIGLYLRVTAEPSDAWRLRIEGEGAGTVPADSDNLIIRTYFAACSSLGLPSPAWDLHVRNEIPLERGLGSSGAAVAAGLQLVKASGTAPVDETELLLAGCEQEGHPDNLMASMVGGLVVNAYDEGVLTYHRHAVEGDMETVVVVPDFRVSTPMARRVLPRRIPFDDAVFNLQRSALTVAAFAGREYGLLRESTRDKLHEPFRQKLIEGYEAIRDAGLAAGAYAVFLSGSGSAMIAFAPNGADTVRDALQDAVDAQSWTGKVLTLPVDNRGAILES